MKPFIVGSLITISLCLHTALLSAQEAVRPSAAPAETRDAEPKAAPRRPDVIFVPTPQEAVERMLEMAQIKKGDVIYDLGCGDGRIVVTAARKYGVKAIGFDLDPQRIKESQENVRTNNVGHLVTIKQADIFAQDLSPANVVTLYLLPTLNVRLMPQLEKLKPGSRVVSYQFDMKGAKPVEVSNNPHTIYKWVTPLQREP